MEQFKIGDTSLVQRLQEKTGCNVQLCKEALRYVSEHDGDEDMAIAFLKAKSSAVKTTCSFDECVKSFMNHELNPKIYGRYIRKLVTLKEKNLTSLEASKIINVLMEEGVIFPPCNVGDTVYVTDIIEGKVLPCKVICFGDVDEDGIGTITYSVPDEHRCHETGTSVVSFIDEIGKTIFFNKTDLPSHSLTKEEPND